MQVTVYVYAASVVTDIRFFRSLAAANRFIAKVESSAKRRAHIHEVTRA